jgi:aerobic-type carbon monoxide dehydrogenase small subunit (CoxS/CutS family)
LLDRLKHAPIARRDLEQAITQALDTHLCRCTGYVRYFEAVRQVVLETPGLVRG